MEEENLRFYPGDVVNLKRMLSPSMLILEKVVVEKEEKKSISFRCAWFTDANALATFVFDARDLLKLKSNKDERV